MTGDRGAALVEASVVLPVFFLIVFSILEYGVLFKEALTVDEISRIAARTATAAGNDGDADYRALRSISAAVSALDRGQLQRIVIYHASGPGDSLSSDANANYATCRSGTAVTGVCNVYVATDLTRSAADFGCDPGIAPDRFWCPNDRKVAQSGTNGPPDYIGVWVTATHQSFTGLIKADETIGRGVVLRIEPRILA